MKPLALIVESDGGTRRLLDVLLVRLGMQVDLVATTSDALLLLEHVDYDLIFTDVVLGDRSGIEFVERLAAIRSDALERTVILSSSSPTQLGYLRERWPIVRAIRKPFEISEITGAAARVTLQPTRRLGTIGEEFTRRSVRAGAKTGLVVQRNGNTLDAIVTYGYQPAQLDPFMPLSMDSHYPLCVAARHRRPVWIASIALATNDYPALVAVWSKNESRALAAVPIVRDGELLGVAGWAFREPRLFSEHEQQSFLAIAELLGEELASHESTEAM